VQELATMRQRRLNVVAIVFNDNAYGNVRRTQREAFAGHVIAADLVNPDFVALAESFGVRGLRVDTSDALRSVLGDALTANAPILIEVAVGEMPSAWHLVGPAGGGYPVLLPS
jgi:acetolactate synthase I/II/III large subunit